MPRNMSFSLTTEQAKNKTKTVTRRIGWWFLRPGDIVQQVEKGMGLKKGEKVKKIHLIRIKNTEWEELQAITDGGVVEEGFRDKSREWFINMFKKHNHCHRNELVNRIEFEYI